MKKNFTISKKTLTVACGATAAVILVGVLIYKSTKRNELEQRRFDVWYDGLSPEDQYAYDLKAEMIKLDNEKESIIIDVIKDIVNDAVNNKMNQHEATEHFAA